MSIMAVREYGVLSNGEPLSTDINMDTLTLFSIQCNDHPCKGLRDYGVSDPGLHLVIPNGKVMCWTAFIGRDRFTTSKSCHFRQLINQVYHGFIKSAFGSANENYSWWPSSPSGYSCTVPVYFFSERALIPQWNLYLPTITLLPAKKLLSFLPANSGAWYQPSRAHKTHVGVPSSWPNHGVQVPEYYFAQPRFKRLSDVAGTL